MPLPPERINDIKELFRKAKISYNDEFRSILFTDVNFRFFELLRTFNTPAFQLSGDLSRLNSTDRLADGSIPFAIWLRNATNELAPVDTDNILSKSLDELSKGVSTAAPIVDAANVPAVEVREAIVQQNDMVSFGFLLAGSQAGSSVAYLQVPRYENEMPVLKNGEPEVHLGTGWLITPDLIVTNHHVVNARNDGEGNASAIDLEAQSNHTNVKFDFDGTTAAGVSGPAVTKLEATDPALDFAILRLSAPVPSTRRPLPLNPARIEITKDSYFAVNIIQHPYGGPKKAAIRNNLVYDSNFPKVRYFTDTDHGSSGSPVFNDNWEVVALHRASTFVDTVKFQGRLAGWVNEGTHIVAILDFLKQNHAALHKEITGS